MNTKAIKENNDRRVPAILSGQALNSFRDSGYSLSDALGEVIDNSLDAKANNIYVQLDRSQKKTKSKKKYVNCIIIVDDGLGMDAETLQYYPQLGFSSRYMSTQTIGKYGVGAKLAALNYCRRIDVWSRTDAKQEWLHVHFDLDEALEQEKNGEEVTIAAPTTNSIAQDLKSLFPSDSGTVVVWSKVDRLEDGRKAPDAEMLRHQVEKELSRMFRYFIDGGINIKVNNTKLFPHDPLFLMERTWSDKRLSKYYTSLSKTEERERPTVAEAAKKRHFPARRIGSDKIEINGFIATLTVTLYPKEVAREPGSGGDDLAKELKIPENEGCISFVRLDREINYTNVPRIFHRGVQAEDRFIGIEVNFPPDLDDYFGVRNVKRGVEPYEDLRTEIRNRLKKYLSEARGELENIRGEVLREIQDRKGEHKPIVERVAKANRTLPKSRAKSLYTPEKKEKILSQLAQDAVGKDEQKQEEYKERIKDLPFVIETVDFPGTSFIDIQHIDDQVIIRINERHRFYEEMWQPVRSIAERTPGNISGQEASKAAKRTLEALSLLIVAYGKAESMDNNPRERYGDLRSYWGMFADTLMGKIKDVI